MLPPALAVLSRGLAVAPALGWAAVLETAAYGTLRLLVSYGRREVVQDRGGGKVGMLDAMPTIMLEEAAAPDLASGDAVLVDGRLFLVRSPTSTGRGRWRADLEAAQTSRATWSDSTDQARSGRLVFAGCSGPDGRMDLDEGEVAAALTQDPRVSAFPVGARFETDDDAAEFEVLGTSTWAPGWTRLAVRRVA